ncbi:hypothetical protein K3495_g15433 [Podosphaera aphanis]|nr:hypothetical protein K3495_g15433 [Podosphaera aphanis]
MATSAHIKISEIAPTLDKNDHTFGELISSSDGETTSCSLSVYSLEENKDSLVPNLLPPPLASFPTYESLQETIRSWTKKQGYDLIVSKSHKYNSEIVRRYLECGRAGKSQNKRKLADIVRIRITSTHKTGCPMGIYVVADVREMPEGSWSIRHKTSEQSITHNHGPEIGIANHRRYERNNNIISETQRHIEAGITTAQTISILRNSFPDLIQTKHDIRSIKSRFRKETLKSMSPTEALLLRLKKSPSIDIMLTKQTIYTNYSLHTRILSHYSKNSMIF